MKVLMVLLNDFPPDIRVEKEARTLINAGHDVCVLATGDARATEDCNIDGLQVVRIPKPKGLRKKFHEVKNALLHHDRLWVDQILRIGHMMDADAIHGHDLWVLGDCVAAAKRLGIPVLADLHENWPAAVSLFHPRETWLDNVTHPVLFGYKNWVRFEKRILRQVKRVIVVVPEAADRIIRMHGLPPERIVVVSNTEDIDFANKISIDENLANRYPNKFILTYVGGFNTHRGLDFVIESLPTLATRVSNLKLLLVGGGNQSYLQQLLRQSNAEPYVEIIGWQPLEKIYNYIMTSHVCLVPHIRHEHTDNTVPHKLFQYMYMRKPVIVSDCPPLKRIVEETNAGLVFKDRDRKSFCDVVIRLAEDPDLCSDLGEAGHMAVKQKYNWRVDAKVLQQCYLDLAGSSGN